MTKLLGIETKWSEVKGPKINSKILYSVTDYRFSPGPYPICKTQAHWRGEYFLLLNERSPVSTQGPQAWVKPKKGQMPITLLLDYGERNEAPFHFRTDEVLMLQGSIVSISVNELHLILVVARNKIIFFLTISINFSVQFISSGVQPSSPPASSWELMASPKHTSV